MERVLNKTVGALSRFGDRIERRLSTDENYGSFQSGSGSAFYRPSENSNYYSSQRRGLNYGGGRKYSSDNLAASPGYSSFNNYRQGAGQSSYSDSLGMSPYGAGIGGPLPRYGSFSGLGGNMPYGAYGGSVGYAPDYYIAERRQMELIPAPPPRIVPQPVPVPFPVDRPVPRPYPVEVPRPVPVDRPVPFPVPVPSPVPFDRPVPYPVPVPVPSPPPPPMCLPVPVPVASPVPCYVPVGVPVPSPRASPVMFQQSAAYSQSWAYGSSYAGVTPYASYAGYMY